jgi:hypothetical protein
MSRASGGQACQWMSGLSRAGRHGRHRRPLGDQLPIQLRRRGEDGEHQTAGAGGGVDPLARQLSVPRERVEPVGEPSRVRGHRLRGRVVAAGDRRHRFRADHVPADRRGHPGGQPAGGRTRLGRQQHQPADWRGARRGPPRSHRPHPAIRRCVLRGRPRRTHRLRRGRRRHLGQCRVHRPVADEIQARRRPRPTGTTHRPTHGHDTVEPPNFAR